MFDWNDLRYFLELQRSGGRYGLATMCVGVGQGTAVLIERV